MKRVALLLALTSAYFISVPSVSWADDPFLEHLESSEEVQAAIKKQVSNGLIGKSWQRITLSLRCRSVITEPDEVPDPGFDLKRPVPTVTKCFQTVLFIKVFEKDGEPRSHVAATVHSGFGPSIAGRPAKRHFYRVTLIEFVPRDVSGPTEDLPE
jgi:hypothetical protein